jgi:DNA-binding NarL/FixJ family response regulator
MNSKPENIAVWLVEDNAVFAQGVSRVVDSHEGMSCAGAFPSVEEALEELASAAPPDVILLDVQLPGMDGISALKSFRKQAPDARVVILTVFDDADKIFRAVCAGAAGYVLKSTGVDQIGEAIRQVMDGGAPMTPAIAKKVLDAFSRIGPAVPASEESDYRLTERERDILSLMARGMLKKEIANQLDISITRFRTTCGGSTASFTSPPTPGPWRRRCARGLSNHHACEPGRLRTS